MPDLNVTVVPNTLNVSVAPQVTLLETLFAGAGGSGSNGISPTLAVASTVATVPSGTAGSASLMGTSSNPVLSLTLPAGPQGPAGTNGTNATVTSSAITTALGFTPDSPTSTRPPSAHTHTKSEITDFPTIPVLLCPFDPRSSLAFSYDGSGNITTITYTYGGTTQGYADFGYDGSGNLSTITYKGTNHTTVLRTLTFSYSSGTMTGYTVS